MIHSSTSNRYLLSDYGPGGDQERRKAYSDKKKMLRFFLKGLSKGRSYRLVQVPPEEKSGLKGFRPQLGRWGVGSICSFSRQLGRIYT